MTTNPAAAATAAAAAAAAASVGGVGEGTLVTLRVSQSVAAAAGQQQQQSTVGSDGGASAWPRRVCFVDDNSDNAFNVYSHFAMRQATQREKMQKEQLAEQQQRRGLVGDGESQCQAASLLTPDLSSFCSGEELEGDLCSVHAFWFPPPEGGKGEQADPLCRELFERMAELQLTLEQQQLHQQQQR